MIKTGYLGKYQGVPIYTISFKEFYALPKIERDTQELIYMIQEDRHVITGGKVFGSVTIDGKRLNTSTTALDWHITYAPMITKIRKEEEAKRIAEEQAKDAAAAIKIERPTVESLVKDTEKQLQSVKHVAENKVEDLHYEAKKELKEVAVKAEDAVQEVFETAVEVATDMAAESKQMLNQIAAEGAQQAEAVQVKTTTTTTTRRKKKSTTV